MTIFPAPESTSFFPLHFIPDAWFQVAFTATCLQLSDLTDALAK
jgi:hypothetical protein